MCLHLCVFPLPVVVVGGQQSLYEELFVSCDVMRSLRSGSQGTAQGGHFAIHCNDIRTHGHNPHCLFCMKIKHFCKIKGIIIHIE